MLHQLLRLIPADRKEAERIVEVLDGVPLAIEQAGAFLSSGSALQEFRKFYHENYRRLMEERPCRSKWYYDKNRSVFDTFEMLLAKLVSKDENATKILMLAAFLGPGKISTRLFADMDSFTSTVLNPERYESATLLREDKVASDLARWFGDLTKNQLAS